MALFLGDKLIGTNSIGTRIEEKDVNFYDYDNTLLYSFTAEEANALTVLPQLPDRTNINLTNEGWNWLLADIKKQLEEVGGIVDVGCTYHTTDGKTHIVCTLFPQYSSVSLRITPTVANDVTINWGDGNTDTISEASATTTTHTYSGITKGTDFEITIESSNNYYFPTYLCETEENNKITFIKSIFLSKNVASTRAYCFEYLYNLQVLTMHNTMSSNYSTVFGECYQLKCIIIPNNTTEISSRFAYCRTHIILPSTINKATNNARYLSGATINTIPYGVTSIGNDFLRDYKKFTTVYLGKNITSFGTLVFYTSNYKILQINTTTPPTLASSTSLYTISEIRVPESAVNTYKNDSNWANYATRIVAI